jgi:uncharacterized protein
MGSRRSFAVAASLGLATTLAGMNFPTLSSFAPAGQTGPSTAVPAVDGTQSSAHTRRAAPTRPAGISVARRRPDGANRAKHPARRPDRRYSEQVFRDFYFQSRYGHRMHVGVTFPAVNGRRAPGEFPIVAHLAYTNYLGGGEAGSSRGVPGVVGEDRYVRHGYAFAAVDTPGTGKSEGTWQAYDPAWQDEMVDIINWLGTRTWSTGRIGTIGVSGNGMNQWVTAARRPRYLKTMIPQDVSGDFWDIVMQGGMQNMDISLVACTAAGAIPAATNNIGEPWYMYEKLVSGQYTSAECPFTGGWFRHDTHDSFWELRRAKTERIDIPVFCQSSWDGLFPHAMPETCDTVRNKTMMQMGLSAHSPNATPGIDHVATNLKWFDRWLKGRRNGTDRQVRRAGFQYFLQQAKEWRSAPRFPIPGTEYTRFRLAGSPSHPLADGSLVVGAVPPAGRAKYHYSPTSGVFDGPLRNWARIMSPNTAENDNPFAYNEPSGGQDQRYDAAANGNVAFLTRPLKQDTEVTGPIRMRLFASTTAADTDFVFKIVDVFPDDSSENGPQPGYWNVVTYGQLKGGFRTSYGGFHRKRRIPIGKVVRYDIHGHPTGYQFKHGHRIGVIVQSANVPRFRPNRHPSEITVHWSRRYPSHVLLPIIPQGLTRPYRGG